MKIDKYILFGSIGVLIFISGAVWEIGVQYPELFKNIIIDTFIPPTYRLLELTGLVIFIITIYRAAEHSIEKMESE